MFVDSLSKKFGGVQALDDVTFTVSQGGLVGVIGPNGSGKTTIFNIVTGVLKPSAGHVYFRGQDVTENSAADKAVLGMARTFQNIRLFRDLPVIDNVMAGLHMRYGPSFVSTMLNTPSAMAKEATIKKKALKTLELLDLQGRADKRVSNLPYGDQRKVEFARALATEPTLLFLDEPTAGMNPLETSDLAGAIQRLHSELDITIILIEHDMKMVMGLCERIHVINRGCVLAEGNAEDIQNNPNVIEAYLGRRQTENHAAT